MDVTSLGSNHEKSEDNSSTTDSQPYDNAKPGEINLTSERCTDGTPVSSMTPQPPASPRYDRVPNKMEISQESNQSERIYAEVLDVDINAARVDKSNG